jgi:tRNA dimethylallyltransferase
MAAAKVQAADNAAAAQPAAAHNAASAAAAATARAARAAAAAGLPRVVVVAGPTAVGKTAAGLEVALRMNGEVVSADSVQVYARLDVGSDKLPPGAPRRGVPHHLLDVLPFTSDFSAADFHARARAAIADVVARGRTPVVVGGTGLYLRWLVWGRPSTPASDPAAEREALSRVEAARAGAAARLGLARPEDLSESDAWAAATQCLADAGDPEAAARVALERNNYYRLLRALQILILSGGKPLSEQDLDAERPWDYDFRCFYLTRPRIPLYERIAARVEEMLCGGASAEEDGERAAAAAGQQQQQQHDEAKGGLLQEAAMLLDAGLAPGSNMAAKAIGYRQAMEWLCAGAERALEQRSRRAGEEAAAGAGGGAAAQAAAAEACAPVFSLQDLKQLALDVAQASRHLVKGQSTWFRGDPAFTWLDAAQGAEAVASEIVALASSDAPPPAVVGDEGGGGNGGGNGVSRSEVASKRQMSKEELDAVKRYIPALPLLDSSPPGALAALAWANAAVGCAGVGGGSDDDGDGDGDGDDAEKRRRRAAGLERAERWAALARAARKRPSWIKQGPVLQEEDEKKREG